MFNKIKGLTLCVLLFFLPACGGNSMIKSFSRENVSLSHIRRIAVLPFSGSKGAERIREFTMTQILASGTFDVVDKGVVDSVLAQEVIGAGTPIDAKTMKRLGQLLNVQAFIMGSVGLDKISRGGATFPEITMTLRLLDSETGTILWQASGRGSGFSMADRLFGFAPKDSFEVTMKLLKDLFRTIG